VTGTAPDNISRHLSALQDQGLIERQRTGRQSVFVLGEWIDVNGHSVERLGQHDDVSRPLNKMGLQRLPDKMHVRQRLEPVQRRLECYDPHTGRSTHEKPFHCNR